MATDELPDTYDMSVWIAYFKQSHSNVFKAIDLWMAHAYGLGYGEEDVAEYPPVHPYFQQLSRALAAWAHFKRIDGGSALADFVRYCRAAQHPGSVNGPRQTQEVINDAMSRAKSVLDLIKDLALAEIPSRTSGSNSESEAAPLVETVESDDLLLIQAEVAELLEQKRGVPKDPTGKQRVHRAIKGGHLRADSLGRILQRDALVWIETQPEKQSKYDPFAVE